MLDQWANEQVTMVAGMEVMHGLQNVDFLLLSLRWPMPMHRVQSAPYLMETWQPPSGRSMRSDTFHYGRGSNSVLLE